MSKLGIIVKNYLKLIMRNKVMLVVVVFSTMLVIAALSSAFHTLLDSAEELSEFSMGYSISDDSRYSIVEDSMMEQFEEADIRVRKYDKAEPMSLVERGEVDVFIGFEKDDYHIYGDSAKELQARMVQYVLYTVDSGMEMYSKGIMEAPEIGYETLDSVETSEAENYYGIIENVYFIALCSVFLAMIFQTERKNNIGIRFRVGNANGVTCYLAKFFSCAIVSLLCQSVICVGLTTLLFDVKIGVPTVSFLILFLETLAFVAFGLLFFILFDNLAVSIGLLFMSLWFAGFVGGTFETYMYSVVPDSIKELSPIYYVNRSIVELSVLGQSDFVKPCIIYMLAIIVVCMPLGILITAKKREV